MNTFDFPQFYDGGISHLASLTSWSMPRSRVKKMMMMMIIIIIIIITNHWFLSSWMEKKWLLKSTWFPCLCESRVYWSLHFKFLTKLPIFSKFWINLIIVADDLYRPFLFPKPLITTRWTCRILRRQGH